MAYLDSSGLQTLWTKIKTTFARNVGVTTGDDAVTVILKDGAATPNQIASVDISAATTSAAGVMSKADKIKLNGIEAGANNYIHPTTTGNKHVPSGGASGKILGWDSDGTAKWIDAPETTYVFNTAYNASTNKAATMSDIQTALTGAAKYKGTIANEAAFTALANYKVGDYYVASASFSHTVGSSSIYVETGNMIFCNTDYSTAYSASHFDIIQADIEAISTADINALS